jgi:hypothetical protein
MTFNEKSWPDGTRTGRDAGRVSQLGELLPEGLPVILIRSRTWRQPGNLLLQLGVRTERHGPTAGPGLPAGSLR